MWWKYFGSSDAEALGRELASLFLSQLDDAHRHAGRKFQIKAGKALVRAERRIVEYKNIRTVNWYQRSRAANAFLWTLKDGACPEDYANELTEWFVLQLQSVYIP